MFSIFAYSEGLSILSGLGTLGGLAATGYGVYTYAYYHYEITKAGMASQKTNGGSAAGSAPSGTGVGGAGTPAATGTGTGTP